MLPKSQASGMGRICVASWGKHNLKSTDLLTQLESATGEDLVGIESMQIQEWWTEQQVSRLPLISWQVRFLGIYYLPIKLFNK